MYTRVGLLLPFGVVGAGLMWLFPPTRATEWRLASAPTAADPYGMAPAAADTYDAGPGWRWDLPARIGGTHCTCEFVLETDDSRLVAQWGLWVGVLFVGAVLGRRVAGDPARPALAAVRAGALVVAGFAVTNAQLAAAVALARGGSAADELLAGDMAQVAFYASEYGWPLPVAAAAWVAAGAVGRTRATRPSPPRATPPAPPRATPPALAWVREVRPWPAEHWLGGPAEPGVAPARSERNR